MAKVPIKNTKFACYLERHGDVAKNEIIEVEENSKTYFDLVKAGWELQIEIKSETVEESEEKSKRRKK